jgi:putative hydrolase of the HAD superfamily
MSRASSGMPVAALFLDLDETLLDGSRFDGTVARTCQEVADLSGLNARRLLEANSGVFREYWPEVFDRWTLGSLDGAALSLEAWRRTLRAYGYHDDSLAQRASQIHLQLGRESYRLFDDARELLAAATRFGLRLALITNGASDTQRDKLQALGIETSFDVIVISGEVGIAKPDAYPFELALSQLALPPERVWHIGDNLVTDVSGAKAASLRAVWVNRNGRPRQASEPVPDVEIKSLCDLIGELSE